MKELNLEQLEYTVGMMKSLRKDHPKANVTFSTEDMRVHITCPMPNDYLKIKEIRFTEI